MHSIHAGNPPPSPDRVLGLGVACLVLLSTGLFLPQLADAFHTKNHVVSLGGCLLFLLYLVRQPSQGARLPAVVCVACAACFCSILVSGLAATQSIIAWRNSLELLPLGLIFYLLIQQENLPQAARALEVAWLLAALVVAVLALLQAINPQWADMGLVAPGKLVAFSTLGNPIWASIVLVVALPLALAAALKGPGWLWLCPPVLSAALWVTESRQAWLALVLMGWIALMWKGNKWPRRLALAAGVVLLCALPFVDFSAGVFHSLQGRLLIMRGAWQMFLSHPLTGVGLGHLGAAYPPYQAALLADPAWQVYAGHAAVVDDAHNEFLQWAATTGAMGLFGITLLCGTVAWLGWRSGHVQAQLWHWYLGYCGLLVTLLFTGIQSQSTLCLLLVSCMAVVLAGASARAPRRPMHRHTRGSAGMATLAFTMLVALWAQQDVHASYLEGQGDRLMQDRDAWLAQDVYANALRVDAQRGSLLKKHATTLYLDGRYADALAELTQARTLSGDTGVALLQAEILATMGRDAEAIAAYQSIVASFPQLLSPRFVLGQLYYRQHQPALARAEFQRVVQMAPSTFNQRFTQEKVQQQKQMAVAFIAALDRQH